MEPEQQNNEVNTLEDRFSGWPTAVILITIAFLFVGLATYIFLTISKNQEPVPAAPTSLVEDHLSDASTATRRGDHEDALSTLRAIKVNDSELITPTQEARLLSLTAINLLDKNGPGDRAEAIATYKLIATTDTFPAAERAFALADLALISKTILLNGSDTERFIRENVFSGEFSKYLANNDDNTYDAIHSLYTASDLIYENDFAKVGSLSYYTTTFYDSPTPNTSAAGTAETLRRILNSLTISSNNVEETVREYGISRATEMYYGRALAMAALNRIAGDYSYNELEQAFATAIIAATTVDTVSGVESIARVYHAAFISNRSDDETELNKIPAILAPLEQKTGNVNERVCDYFAAIYTKEYYSFAKESILRLNNRDLSPQLTTFLTSCGWTF